MSFDDVVIVATHNTTQARSLPGHDSRSIALEACHGLLAQSGIGVDAVESVFGSMAADLVYDLGIVNGVALNSAPGIRSVFDAASAIESGMVRSALVVEGGAGHRGDARATATWTRPTHVWVNAVGLYTAAEFALVARQHMSRYGSDENDFAAIAARIRTNGSRTPGAVYEGQGPFTASDILASRMIAEPFRLLDCATTSEGGAAMLLMRRDVARDHFPESDLVEILGIGINTNGPMYKFPPSWELPHSATADSTNGNIGRSAARAAFRMAGLSPSDVDVYEGYDPFSFEVLRQLEAFEFFADGEAKDAIRSGWLDDPSTMAIVTDGGTMSYSHAKTPQLLQRVMRAAQQIQGRAGPGQVADAGIAFASNGGAGALFCDAIVLGGGR
ncbi:MAG: thiolase family protein [Actinomycetales bacterium]|nr:thiolase family protein [Actinomycetales bacterium]